MKKRTKVKKVVPYNERERNAKILNLTLQISNMGMSSVLTPEIKKRMNDFVVNGNTYIDCIELPKLSRQMVIQLINDKHQQTFINFKYVSQEEPCCGGGCCEKKECEKDVDKTECKKDVNKPECGENKI